MFEVIHTSEEFQSTLPVWGATAKTYKKQRPFLNYLYKSLLFFGQRAIFAIALNTFLLFSRCEAARKKLVACTSHYTINVPSAS